MLLGSLSMCTLKRHRMSFKAWRWADTLEFILLLSWFFFFILSLNSYIMNKYKGISSTSSQTHRCYKITWYALDNEQFLLVSVFSYKFKYVFGNFSSGLPVLLRLNNSWNFWLKSSLRCWLWHRSTSTLSLNPNPGMFLISGRCLVDHRVWRYLIPTWIKQLTVYCINT